MVEWLLRILGARQQRGSWKKPWSGRHRRLVLGVGGLLALGVVLSACGAATVSKVKPKKEFTVAFVPGVAHNSFYLSMEAPAKAEAAKLGIRLIWEAPATFSVEAEVPLLETLLSEHPNVLILTPDDPVALKAPVQEFISAGIPVITVDTTLADSSILLSRITSDGYEGGILAAQAIGKRCGDKGTTFAMGSNTSTTTQVQRANGFLKEMQKYPGMTVLPVQYDQHSSPIAASITAALLTSHPGMCGIFGTNNTAAEGIASAVLAAGLEKKVMIVGFDAGPGEVALLKGGVISTLIIQRPALEAVTAVQYAYDYLTGQRSKIRRSVDLNNVVATTADARSASIEKYYYGA